MSLTLTINYDTAGNFTFDSSKVEFVGSNAQLKLENLAAQTFNQAFTSSTGFLFDANLTEFSAGQVQQKDQRPANATFHANYNTDLNGNWGNGVLTGTPTGGAAVSGGRLDLKNEVATAFVDYDGVNNVDGLQTGTVRFTYIPDYTGNPPNNMFILLAYEVAAVNNNHIRIVHLSGGLIDLRINDSAGASIVSATLSGYSAVSGVATEFELNYDVTAGATRFFAAGTQLGATQTGTGTRTATIDRLRIGENSSPTNLADFEIDDVIWFDAVQHTANYTPGASIPATIYTTDLITLPLFTYAGLGVVQSFDSFATTETGAPRYVLNGLFFNGSIWTISDLSYAQANSKADVNTNISTHPASDTLDIDIVTQTDNTQEKVDDLTVTYSGQQFNTTNPTVLINSGTEMDALDGFTETATKPSGSEIKYTLVVNGQAKFFDTVNWVNSDGTFTQSNTAAEIETNKAALDLSAGITMKVNAFLNSDGTVNPLLTTVVVNYDFFQTAIPPNECVLFGWVRGVDGAGIVGASVKIFTKKPFHHGDDLITINSTVTTGADGRWEASVVETTTVSQLVQVEYTYTEDGISRTSRFRNLTIPDQATCDIGTVVNPPTP